MNKENLLTECWKEKKINKWEDRYGKERERYYNRNGWGSEEIECEKRKRKDCNRNVIDKRKEYSKARGEGKNKES